MRGAVSSSFYDKNCEKIIKKQFTIKAEHAIIFGYEI